MNWQSGINGERAIGNWGRYRGRIEVDTRPLATGLWREGGFWRAVGGAAGSPLVFGVAKPPSYSVEQRDADWTGMALDYGWDGGGVTVQLRSTLPGPLFVAQHRTIDLRWAALTPRRIEALDGSGAWTMTGVDDPGDGRLLLVPDERTPVLIVLNRPIKRIAITAQRNWTIEFRSRGGAALVVPLLDQDDVPRTRRKQEDWRALVRKPPLRCDERFAIEGRTLHLEQRFKGAALSPLPPSVALLGGEGGLVKAPRSRTLCRALTGPYAVVDGDAWRAKVATGWSGARIEPTREVTGRLSPLPRELVYAGDWTWEPGTAMDQLLSLRTWAPLVGVMPQRLRRRVAPMLAPPAPGAFRRSLETVVEPNSGRTWMKEDRLFEHWGDVSFDADWYNGLTLSGLARAVECDDEAIASKAARLAEACRSERQGLIDYFELFHDWAACSAPTDPVGFWVKDCVQNGMEGLLAEARLRRREGDDAGADRMRYLAGRTAIALMASFKLPAWCAALGYIARPRGGAVDRSTGAEPKADEMFGINGYHYGRGVSVITPATKNPYCLPNHCPEHHALLKAHGPVEALRRLARIWRRRHRERYADWVRFYVPAGAKRRFHEERDQEARDQAAVFYHLAPEVCFRRYVLEEPPDRIERLYGRPLNLAEQLLLRSGMRVVGSS